MAHSSVVAAVKSRLDANWTHCTILSDLNLADGEAPPAPFLAVLYPVSNAEQMSVGAPGSNIWREEGGFQLVLNLERGYGLSGYLPWADELADLFRGKSFDGVQTFAPTTAIFDNSNEDGNYFQISVAVPYQYDLIG